MTHPALLVPDAFSALQALNAAVLQTGVSKELVDLAILRASQINGCSACVDMHSRDLRKAGESDERLWSVAAWREAPYFSDDERAALALAEAMTRLADQSDPVPDELWNEVTSYFDEQTLAGLILAIAHVNLWNRLNATTRQVAGAYTG